MALLALLRQYDDVVWRKRGEEATDESIWVKSVSSGILPRPAILGQKRGFPAVRTSGRVGFFVED
ncbi:MAG: hypothetical protein ACI8UD_002971 [Planctomycetota bacterium]